MKHKLLFLFILLFSSTAFSQLQLELDVVVSDFKSSKKESGATMKVYEGTKVVGTATSGSNGKITLKVPANKVYKVEISKAGKVTRFFNVNSKNIDIELLQGASEPVVRTTVALFDKTMNVDYNFIQSNPITEFYFDGKSTVLAFNKTTSDKMDKKVEEVIASAEKTDGNNEVQYQAKMKDGEALAAAGNYSEALTKFEQASMFKKNDKTAIDRMDAMDKLIKADKISQIDGQVAGGAYDNLIQAAKTLKSQKKYQLAIDKYEEALDVKRNDQFALDEIDALMEIIQKEKRDKANESAYAAAMTTGETLLKQKSYQAARDQYDIALKAKPGDAEATKKKNEVLGFLDAAKGAIEKKKSFDAAILAGDQLFKAEKWEDAKVKYDEALALEAASTYAKGQNDIIKTKLEGIEKAKAMKIQIDQLIADGNKSFADEKWEEAKIKFTEVKKLDDKNAIASEKLAAIQLKLDEVKKNTELEAKFKKLVDEGDLAIKGAKLEEGIAKYTAALELKANPEVVVKKEDAETAFNKLKNQKELKANFDLAMKEGETLLLANKLEEAKTKFTEASALDGTAQLPKDKIKTIDEKILTNASVKEKEEQFNAAMASASTLRSEGKLDEAIAEYKNAQAIDKSKTEPAKKILEVQTEITALAANKSAEEKTAKFNAAMEAGNMLRSTGKLEEAIAEYKKAQGIDATKTEPASKILEVQTEITTLAANKSAGEKTAKFNAAMEAGNTLRSTGKLEEAIVEYNKAQGIDATKTEPASKILEVQTEITTLAANKSAGEKTEKYNAAMSAGNSLRTAGKLEASIVEYKKAQGIDNTQPEPEIIIKQVQDEISALANNKTAKDKQDKYNAAMTAGNALRSAGKLEGAIVEYRKAQAIDDSKTEPADKITEVQSEIASKAVNTDDLAYTELMNAAAILEDAKSYKEALEKYNAAKAVKPGEKKPTEKIKALELIIKNQEAQIAVDVKYNEALKKGNDAMGEEDYLAAIKHFNAANKIKPNETEPVEKANKAEEMSKNKTSEDDNLFEKMLLFAKQKMDEKDFVKAEELIKRAKDNRPTDPRPIQLQKELDKQIKDRKDFQAKMMNAKEAFDKKNYVDALSLYREAKVIMPNDTKPDEGILAAQREISSLENSAQEDEIYLATIKKAETAVSEKNYTGAIEEYKKASAMKPTDKTIDGKIIAIKKIMTDLASAATKQGEKVKFDGLVAQADNLFESSKWNDAKAKYEQANAVIANDPHVLNQIQKCTSNLDKNQNELAKYKQLIADADKKYNAGSYQQAKELYQSALKMSNSDSYPHSQLAKIDGVLNPVFADDGSLPNLGTPTDNSLMEGQALLERAAKVRAHRSSTQFRDKDKDLDDLSVENTKAKTDENQAISIALKNKMEVQELVDVNKDDWRKTVVDSVRFATSELERRDKESDNYDNFEGQEARRMVTQITTDNEEKFDVKHQVFAENTEKVKQTVVSEQDNLLAKSQNLYNQQIDTKGEFSRIEIEVEENYIDDLDDRKLVVDSVRNAQRSLDIAGIEQGQKVMEKSMSIKGDVDQSNLIRQRKDVQSDESRQAVVEVVKAKQNEVSGIENEKQDASYQKSLNTTQDVTNKINAIDVENQANKDNQDAKIAELVSTEKKVVEITTQHQGNDDASRQKSKELITNHVQEVEDITEKGSKAPEQNQVVMKESIDLTSERHNKVEEDQVQKNYEARKFVEDIANKKLAYSEKVANEIGAKYPEGVSQETFQKNGTDGLPVAFITRRVVVKNGHGEVYVRTQTLHAITYSKNGDPSTEFIWQKETSDAKLTRNY